MPILKSKMKALQKQYGKEEGKSIYDKLEAEGKNKRVKPKTSTKKKKIFK